MREMTGEVCDKAIAVGLTCQTCQVCFWWSIQERSTLTTANPNVFLEVGYAWGKGRPTILLVRDHDELPFDVRGQRCLVYGKIRELEEALAKELKGLRGSIN